MASGHTGRIANFWLFQTACLINHTVKYYFTKNIYEFFRKLVYLTPYCFDLGSLSAVCGTANKAFKIGATPVAKTYVFSAPETKPFFCYRPNRLRYGRNGALKALAAILRSKREARLASFISHHSFRPFAVRRNEFKKLLRQLRLRLLIPVVIGEIKLDYVPFCMRRIWQETAEGNPLSCAICIQVSGYGLKTTFFKNRQTLYMLFLDNCIQEYD